MVTPLKEDSFGCLLMNLETKLTSHILIHYMAYNLMIKKKFN